MLKSLFGDPHWRRFERKTRALLRAIHDQPTEHTRYRWPRHLFSRGLAEWNLSRPCLKWQRRDQSIGSVRALRVYQFWIPASLPTSAAYSPHVRNAAHSHFILAAVASILFSWNSDALCGARKCDPIRPTRVFPESSPFQIFLPLTAECEADTLRGLLLSNHASGVLSMLNRENTQVRTSSRNFNILDAGRSTLLPVTGR